MANRRLNDLSAGSNPMPPMATSPITATTGTKSPTNPATGAVNPSYKNKTASLYSRIMGKKTDSAVTARQSPASVVKGGLAAADSLINYFFKDSEESKMRSFLKSYQKKLRAELIDANRAVARHEKRLNDQIIEFEQQERQLKCWGLGQIVPNFRLQAWCRLQRARVVASAACSYQQLLCNKVERTNEYMLQLQESSNSKGKFSLESCLELCLPPEDLLGRDYTAILQSQKLLRLDIVCSTYIKRFRVLEAELRQLNQKPRESVLIAILSDYANIVANDRKISERIEWDITWEEFCDWYAERKTRLQELGERFSAFVEDQREKEGRLFNRWCTSLLGVQDETNTLLLFPVMGSGDAGNNTNGTSIGSASSDHGGIESSIRRMSTDTSIQSQITPISATGVAKVDRTMPSSNPVTNPMTVSTNPTAAFKMTPTSIKAFVKYFANDVLGITYAVPKDLQEANFILTEALFYK